MVATTLPQERSDFYVYAIFRQNGEPCYVGKGRGGRWKDHVRRSCNRHLASIYAKACGDLPIVKVREGLTDAEAMETEVALIAAIGRGNIGPLVNQTDGGDGASGAIRSDETRAKMSVALSRHKKTAEHIENIAAPQRGRALSPEHVARAADGIRRSWINRAVDDSYRASIESFITGRIYAVGRDILSAIGVYPPQQTRCDLLRVGAIMRANGWRTGEVVIEGNRISGYLPPHGKESRSVRKARLAKIDPWRDRIEKMILGRSYAICAEILRDLDVRDPEQGDVWRVGSIMRIIGWRRAELRMNGVRKKVYLPDANLNNLESRKAA